jgi:surface antigen
MRSLPRYVRRAGLALFVAIPCATLATPPDWAPAHGWRSKNDPTYAHYKGHSGREWNSDYGVYSGACDRVRVGQVLGGIAGGAVGGVIGASAGSGTANREIAIVVGTVIGATVGSEIGRRMDQADRSCVGHALELADAGHSVKWTNPNTRVTYQVTPLDDSAGSDGCRRFRIVAHDDVGLNEGRSVACPDDAGVWSPAEDTRVSRR